ncbi:MAG: RNA methyltransferase [Leptonema sp. (in: Bacteria)]|nr:RNA methyltransferase [Leptonema sp. (in: bacteria)]
MHTEKIEKLSQFITPQRLSRFQQVLSNRSRHLTIILEDIYDPHNGSACLRSCEACGVQEVHIIEERHQFTATDTVAMGSARWLDLTHYTSNLNSNLPSTQKCYHDLKNRGYTIVAMTPHPDQAKSVEFHQLPLTKPIALAFGSEKEGLTATALDLADIHTRLPIYGFVESYNISVACAISVFQLTDRIRNGLPENQWQLDTNDYQSTLLKWLRSDIRNIDQIEQQLS